MEYENNQNKERLCCLRKNGKIDTGLESDGEAEAGEERKTFEGGRTMGVIYWFSIVEVSPSPAAANFLVAAR